MTENKIKCCFCGKEIEERESDNPQLHAYSPHIENVLGAMRCCHDCNESIVIPTRIYIHERRK